MSQNSIQTGVAVAKMVKSFGMVHKVIVDGTNILKTLSAKRVSIYMFFFLNFLFISNPSLAELKESRDGLSNYLHAYLFSNPFNSTENNFIH